MLAPITIRYPFRPARRSLIVGEVADLFGLDEDQSDHLIVENLILDIQPQQLVLITGPSGSGKSSLLREIARQLHATDATTLILPDTPLIEALPGSTEQRLGMLANCGLSEARLLLRTPRELSDGQRYRFRMAYALATAQQPILLDEFTAMLDRTLAKVVSFNLRKLVARSSIGVLAATTHEDIVEDLNPDVWIQCKLNGSITTQSNLVKKNTSPSAMNSGSPRAPTPTGRTSLGGITGVTTSHSPAV